MTYALVLSGGGARGIAHLGVLQALEECNIKISAISGTSAGGIVGAFYASGYSPMEILNIIKETSFFKLLRPALSTSGLLQIDSLGTLFNSYLTDSFESLKIPLTINATNLDQGRSSYFSSGELIRPILAASCIPAIFKPIEIDHNRYVDGGMLNNLPVQPFLESSHKIIGVHTNPIDNQFTGTNAKTIIERCLLMAISGNTTLNIPKCDYYLEPPFLGKFGGMDLSKSEELFDIGYAYTKENIGIFDLNKS
jgi:NTE family protein